MAEYPSFSHNMSPPGRPLGSSIVIYYIYTQSMDLYQQIKLDQKGAIFMKKNIWLNCIMGLVVGDALGCPVQFLRREEIRKRGFVTGMEGYGTYNMPEGTWTDDSSMALATLDSMIQKKGIDPEDIMKCFMKWEFEGEYTPFGKAFDEGMTCTDAIYNFRDSGDYKTCGRTGEYANGNGALVRILPVCLYFIQKNKRIRRIYIYNECWIQQLFDIVLRILMIAKLL